MRASLQSLVPVVLLLLAGCEDLVDPLDTAEGPMVGTWTITSVLVGDSVPRSECRERSTLVITEHSFEGALTWTLDQVVDCDATPSWFPGTRQFHDTRWNHVWARVRGDSVGIQTPDPWLLPSCWYLGTVNASYTRMGGRVICQGGPMTPAGMTYRGSWEGFRN